MTKYPAFLLLLLSLGAPVAALPIPSQVTKLFYQSQPKFPQGATNADQSSPQNLIRRLVTYHIYIKGRSPYSRFDWKLTVADYLGVNETIRAEEYPGREELAKNAYLDDQKLISQLPRSQREALIQTMLTIYRQDTAREPA